jgi:hypothetical protein
MRWMARLGEGVECTGAIFKHDYMNRGKPLHRLAVRGFHSCEIGGPLSFADVRGRVRFKLNSRRCLVRLCLRERRGDRLNCEN